MVESWHGFRTLLSVEAKNQEGHRFPFSTKKFFRRPSLGFWGREDTGYAETDK